MLLNGAAEDQDVRMGGGDMELHASWARHFVNPFAACLIVFACDPAFAFVFRVGYITFQAVVPDGINSKQFGNFATFTEAANYTCTAWGFPRGVYPPYAAQVEAGIAADPWIGFAGHYSRFDVTCINNSGGTSFANPNRQTGFQVMCDAPSVPGGNSPIIGFGECRITCPNTQLDANGNRNTALIGEACGDSSGLTMFGLIASDGTVPPKYPSCGIGNPCDPGSGMKSQPELIYAAGSMVFPLRFALQYRSRRADDLFEAWRGVFGVGWSSNFDRRLKFYDPATGPGLTGGSFGIRQADGREFEFKRPTTGNIFPPATADNIDRLERFVAPDGSTAAWQYTSADGDQVQRYDPKGVLLSFSDRAGNTYRLTYASGSSNDTSVSRYPADAPVCSRTHPAPFSSWLVAAKRLLCINDPMGHQLNFEYDAVLPLVVKMYDPAGGVYRFEYDVAQNLTKVSFPDDTARVFHYNEAANINGGAACTGLTGGLPHQLTGITDENGQRFADYEYDCNGRATSTRHAGGAQKITFQYNTDGTTDVSDFVGDPAAPVVVPRRYSFQKTLALKRTAAISDPATGQPKPCASCDAVASTTYDGNGNVATRTDWNGNRTNYAYDLTRNLETSRTEGLTSAGGTTLQTRTISTVWDTDFRLPIRIADPLRITSNLYDPDGTTCGARGGLCSRTIQATTDADGSQGFSATQVGVPRTWTYTYNGNGSVLTVDGPRTDVSDVTTYTYYANDDPDLGKRGNVATISNAGGQLTSITTYNAHGQPMTIVDPNGMTITLTYDERLRLKSRTVGGELTSYDYDNAGQLTKVTLPDSSYLAYTYDAAHRLTVITDNLGNGVSYMLDALGNRTREEMRDPASNLVQTRARVYNDFNQLFQEIGAQTQTTEYRYDDQGNVLTVKDPLNHTTTNQYDALNRLRQGTDPGLGVTQYAYNGLDVLTQVIDPRRFSTSYTVDGLVNLTLQASPDTGNTANTYDAAGNLLTRRDAKDQVTAYAYDALNRVALITFHDGSREAYAYDQGANGIGHLSSITETDAANNVTSQIAYAYDLHGRVTSETRTLAGVSYSTGYAYDASGRMTGMTYSDGRVVTYILDALGRVAQIDTTKDSDTRTVVSGVTYQPFGGVKSYTLGNGHVYTRSYDQDGRIASYTLAATTYAIGYDAASRIEFISDTGNPANSNTYGYDALDRLTSATTATTPYSYSYDAVGNRLSKTVGGGTDTYTYSATSNRIASITPASGPARSFVFDANGSTTADGKNTYAYDPRGRMVQATSSVGTTTYQVNALGQRVRKTNSAGDTIFLYDTRGHLIAETDRRGGVKRQYIYLGDIPVGIFQ